VANICAYCGRKLQVVAGFCAHCHAPVEIASQARLVARALSASQTPVAASEVTVTPPPLPSTPLPRLPSRMLLCGGIVALALVVVAVSLRLGVNPIRALAPPSGGELHVTLPTGSDDVSTIGVGMPFALRYAITVTAATALVTLTIAPDGLPARSMTEQWLSGTTQRSQTMVAVTPGQWQITIARNGSTLQEVDLTIIGSPTSMINHS
jgi:hypothetical protein